MTLLTLTFSKTCLVCIFDLTDTGHRIILLLLGLIFVSSEMLRSDMRSLTEEGTGSSLNLQQRVISSGMELHRYDAFANEAL